MTRMAQQSHAERLKLYGLYRVLVLVCFTLISTSVYGKEIIKFDNMSFEKERQFLIAKNQDIFNGLIKLGTEYFIGIAKLDLNGDNIEDFIAHISSTFHCGAGLSGCPTEIYIANRNGEYQLVHGFRSFGKLKVKTNPEYDFKSIISFGQTHHLDANKVWIWSGEKYVISNKISKLEYSVAGVFI